MERVIKDLVIMVTRAQADRSNQSCLTASLAEAAVTTGSRRIVNLNKLNQIMGVDQTGNTPPGKLFNHLRKGADALDLEIVEVIANPSFLDHCDNPDDQSITARTATGTVDIARPHVRVMANEYKPEVFALHGELDDGSKRSTRRIKDLESRGWFTATAIVLRRKSNE